MSDGLAPCDRATGMDGSSSIKTTSMLTNTRDGSRNETAGNLKATSTTLVNQWEAIVATVRNVRPRVIPSIAQLPNKSISSSPRLEHRPDHGRHIPAAAT